MARRDREDAKPRSESDEVVSYSLDELAREAGVTPRTVRYYIAEGLVPPPETAGRHARYAREHLDRLRLIGEMKEAYLPLREIRRRLAGMAAAEIRQAVRPARSRDSREWGEPASSAGEYLARVLQESDAVYAVVADSDDDVDADWSVPPLKMSVPLAGMRPERSWMRIAIGEEAELLITQDAWERRGDRLESALEWIRRMLDE